MSKKSSGKTAVWIIAIILVAAVVGGGTYIWYDTQLKAQQQRITSLQSQVAAGAGTGNPAYLELTEAGNFDFEDEIDANGGVAADDTVNDATPAPTLVIENMDTNDAATNVYITMWDPESQVGGIPTSLEDTTLSFYVTYNGVLIPLYLSVSEVGTYSNGVNIGTIPVGGAVSALTFSAIADAAADDTYDDSGADYTIHAYVYQADAGSSQPASWTLLT